MLAKIILRNASDLEGLDFLEILDFFFKGGGSTPPGLGVAYPHIVPTSP